MLLKEMYQTERLILVLSNLSLSGLVREYFICNKEFLKDTEPLRNDEFYSIEYQKSELEKDINNIKNLTGLRFWIMKKEETSKIIGMVSFGNIIMGAFKSCFLSYRLDVNEINNGFITEAISKCIDIVFNEVGLHRIEANIMPRNKASIRVVEKLGFKFEGTAKNYLNINGIWEDHIHMVKLNDKCLK